MDAHEYTLIGAKEITLDDCSTERLIKIRNPYGKKEWTGDWGDKSKKWTLKTSQQVNGEDKDDGCFFISFKDFMAFFTLTTICHYMPENVDNCVVD